MRTTVPEEFFTSGKWFGDVYDGICRRHGLKTECVDSYEEYLNWKIEVRAVLREITGMSKLSKIPLLPKKLGETREEDHIREKWVIQTCPDVWMPFYVLTPLDKKDKMPCVIATHGHDCGGKLAVAHRTDIPAVKDKIEKYNYTYGIELVRRGFVVFCPDARGFGERREPCGQSERESDYVGSTCSVLNNVAICLGLSLTGLWIWDLMCLVDYVATRDECDFASLSCAGLSGGGLQCLWLSALDDRIQRAVVSGYFYGYRDSLLDMPENCSCNYVPGLWAEVDMGDLGALIAPRPLLVESGDEDVLNGARGVINTVEQVEIARVAYRLCDAEENLRHHVFNNEHMWCGEEAYPFLTAGLDL